MVSPTRILFVALASCLSAASAHFALAPSTVASNSSGLVAVRVGHGCDGAATTAVTVLIPVGITSVRPSYVPGWNTTITTRPSSATSANTFTDNISKQTYTGGNGLAASATTAAASSGHQHRRATAEDTTVDTITWSGGNIPDDAYFDFFMKLTTPAAETTLYFPVIQVCGDNSSDWFETAATTSGTMEYPVPTLKITAAQASSVSAGVLSTLPSGAMVATAIAASLFSLHLVSA
ncbi:hypothetical protein H4R33_006121 [Dimargaris cristalligena]|uniref:YncI copper-binding domain-containing protein n=1 Tax=Dimargaris cristalligena TaxID=215637 RepID=A0A4Q0A426_9FUNG|nr:hypothetical protein H4R33_006121 [Dimargaris cristalligena]RKP40010.1 hypothetical protein BJ085DRAFT_31021 [Dimargaris cristalligena]|eukprot:RKP40010.1 hypothetical protein BJ085DRAFT_31021 [Dimargaris cristalligena]